MNIKLETHLIEKENENRKVLAIEIINPYQPEKKLVLYQGFKVENNNITLVNSAITKMLEKRGN